MGQLSWSDYDLTADKIGLDCTEEEVSRYNRIKTEALRYYFGDHPENATESEIVRFIGANWTHWLRRAFTR